MAAERQAPGERGRRAVVPHHASTGPRPAAAPGSKAEQRGPSHTALEKHMNNLAYSGKQAPPARRTPCSALSGAAAWLSLPTHAAAPPLPGHHLGMAQGVLAKLPPHPGVPLHPQSTASPPSILCSCLGRTRRRRCSSTPRGSSPQQCLAPGVARPAAPGVSPRHLLHQITPVLLGARAGASIPRPAEEPAS